jgi:hypothetical protein
VYFVLILIFCNFLKLLMCQLMRGWQKTLVFCNLRIAAALLFNILHLVAIISLREKCLRACLKSRLKNRAFKLKKAFVQKMRFDHF